jgi:hypothetical protein
MDTSQNGDLRRENSFLSEPASEKPITEFSAAQPYNGASDATAVFHSNNELATSPQLDKHSSKDKPTKNSI